MKISTSVLTVFLAIFSFSSCGDSSKSENNNDALGESNAKSMAISVHEESGRLAKEFHVRLATEFANTPTTDSSFIKLVSLDSRYVTWSKTMVKLPGTECNHEEGELHIHDHAAEEKLAELSDDDLLKLQNAIQEELKVLISDFDILIESNKQ
ncbi:MAG TPA: hypothetical protein EYQ21_00605 [Flavobacteriales bacterium]|nr:hypothetical protein [Flavobacteriales bacterium]